MQCPECDSENIVSTVEGYYCADCYAASTTPVKPQRDPYVDFWQERAYHRSEGRRGYCVGGIPHYEAAYTDEL